MNIEEQWLELPRFNTNNRSISAVSNTGKFRRVDGTIGILKLRHLVRYYGKLELCRHIIAEHFLITVKRPDQIQIDHITHYPTEYHVQNVLNLRYCTQAENTRFEEARENVSKSLKGKYCGEKSSMYGRTGEKHPMYGKKHTEEARRKMSENSHHLSGEKHPMYGRTGENAPMYGKGYLQRGNKNHNWKGDNARPQAKYKRALRLYKSGLISEPEFQRSREAYRQYRRKPSNSKGS